LKLVWPTPIWLSLAFTADRACTLLKSVDASNPVGLRDRAILAVLIYTQDRVGAAMVW
jgi:hypothetical protein